MRSETAIFQSVIDDVVQEIRHDSDLIGSFLCVLHQIDIRVIAPELRVPVHSCDYESVANRVTVDMWGNLFPVDIQRHFDMEDAKKHLDSMHDAVYREMVGEVAFLLATWLVDTSVETGMNVDRILDDLQAVTGRVLPTRIVEYEVTLRFTTSLSTSDVNGYTSIDYATRARNELVDVHIEPLD